MFFFSTDHKDKTPLPAPPLTSLSLLSPLPLPLLLPIHTCMSMSFGHLLLMLCSRLYPHQSTYYFTLQGMCGASLLLLVLVVVFCYCHYCCCCILLLPLLCCSCFYCYWMMLLSLLAICLHILRIKLKSASLSPSPSPSPLSLSSFPSLCFFLLQPNSPYQLYPRLPQARSHHSWPTGIISYRYCKSWSCWRVHQRVRKRY